MTGRVEFPLSASEAFHCFPSVPLLFDFLPRSSVDLRFLPPDSVRVFVRRGQLLEYGLLITAGLIGFRRPTTKIRPVKSSLSSFVAHPRKSSIFNCISTVSWPKKRNNANFLARTSNTFQKGWLVFFGQFVHTRDGFNEPQFRGSKPQIFPHDPLVLLAATTNDAKHKDAGKGSFARTDAACGFATPSLPSPTNP